MKSENRISGHSEPVTDVTGVRIPEIGAVAQQSPTDGTLKIRGILTPACALAQNDGSIVFCILEVRI